ncbi:hypothetical protein HDE_08564 [Halotydeus destructor]|nr:hypothetical protein HDE_08564 [Halotydeus destructor]
MGSCNSKSRNRGHVHPRQNNFSNSRVSKKPSIITKLTQFDDGIIKGILNFHASIWDLFQFRATNKRFEALTSEVVKNLSSVDLRFPGQHEPAALGIRRTLCSSFGDNLKEIRCTKNLPSTYWAIFDLPAFLPQLFAKELMFFSKFEYTDAEYDIDYVRSDVFPLTFLYKSITVRQVDEDEDSYVIKRHDKIQFEDHDFKSIVDYMLKLDYGEKYDAVKEALSCVRTLRIVVNSGDVDYIIMLSGLKSWFANLVSLEIQYKDGFDLSRDTAKRLKNFIVDSSYHVTVDIEDDEDIKSADGLIEVQDNILMMCLSSEALVGHLMTNVPNYSKLEKVCFAMNDLMLANQLPSSVKWLRLWSLTDDIISDAIFFFTSRGDGLQTLELVIDRDLSDQSLRKLLNSVAISCINLTEFRLSTYIGSDCDVNSELQHLIQYRGATLKRLNLINANVTFDVISDILSNCGKMEHLFVIGTKGVDHNKLASISGNLQNMIKLKDATIQNSCYDGKSPVKHETVKYANKLYV